MNEKPIGTETPNSGLSLDSPSQSSNHNPPAMVTDTLSNHSSQTVVTPTWTFRVTSDQPAEPNLVKMEPLQKMIECVLISPYIKDEKPVSLLIVAKPESGKTTTMKQYRENKGISYLSDCTAYGLTTEILPKIVNGEVKTLMLPDIITPLAKQTKTRQSFTAFLNNLIEEGVAKIATYSTSWNTDVNANVITAVTDEELKDARHNWAKMGFLSRFIVFSYSYSLSTVTKILNHYSTQGLISKQIKLNLPDKPVSINLPKGIADKLDPLAMAIGRQCSLYGLRAKVNLRALLKTIAYRNGRDTVTDQDYQEFLELADFMNFLFKQV
jgi:hypothetical protein